MKKACAFILCISLGLYSASAETPGITEGTVTAAYAAAVVAAAGGTVETVSASSGDRIAAEGELFSLTTEKVFASEDGTVSAVFAGEGESADDAVDAYGSVLSVAPVSRYTITCTTDDGYDTPKAMWITLGETLFIRCLSDGSHRGIGEVTAVSDTAYTVEMTGGCMWHGEAVALYRKSDFSVSSKVGIGTVLYPEETVYTASGTVVKMYVKEGEIVQRGELLFETAEGDTADTAVKSPVQGIVGSVSAAVGDTVAAGDIVALIYPDDSLRAEVVLSESDVRNVEIGQTVYLAFSVHGEALRQGVVEAVRCGLDGQYTAVIRFTADKDIRIGMSVSVRFDTRAALTDDTASVSLTLPGSTLLLPSSMEEMQNVKAGDIVSFRIGSVSLRGIVQLITDGYVEIFLPAE